MKVMRAQLAMGFSPARTFPQMTCQFDVATDQRPAEVLPAPIQIGRTVGPHIRRVLTLVPGDPPLEGNDGFSKASPMRRLNSAPPSGGS